MTPAAVALLSLALAAAPAHEAQPPADAPATQALPPQPAASAEPAESAADAAAFAAWLFEREDYYRAIGEYQRALFLAPASPRRAEWELRIGEAYRRGEQHQAALRQFDRVAEEQASVRPAALLGAAKSALGARMYETAAERARAAAAAFGEGPRVREARFVEGWALLETGRDSEARKAFEAASGGGPVGEGSARVVKVLPQLEHLPSRSPVVAGLLGAVPGLGHLYIGEPAIALSAFVWNGLFIWATVQAARDENWSLAAVLGAFEAMWYGGSILGAVSGAHKYNRDVRQRALGDIARIAPADLPDQFREMRQPAPR